MISLLYKTLLIVAVMTCVGFSQPTRRSPSAQPLMSAVAFEAIPLFSTDTSVATVQIHYRIRQDFFVILRNIDAASGNPYLGKGELIVELKDDNGNSAAREFRSIVLAKNTSQENDRSPDIQGAFTLTPPPGKYTVWFSLDDAQSERSFVNKTQTVITRSPTTTRVDISSPVFVVPSPSTDSLSSFDVLNHGTAVFFGESGGFLFNVFLPSDSALTLRYHLSNQTEFKALPPQEFEGDSIFETRGIAALQRQPGDGSFSSTFPIRYVRSSAAPGWYMVYVPLPLQKLYPGEVTIKLDFASGSFKKHFDHTFKIFWDHRPLSLANLEFAVEALRHIATEEEMENFHTLSDSRFVQAFFDFWKQKDRDTTTAYNELMLEYYRRVDLANQRYSSTREMDGYKSDQGRIFILYGSPTRTERLFSPSSPAREVWTYTQLKKRFIFEDQNRSGVYILTTIENL